MGLDNVSTALTDTVTPKFQEFNDTVQTGLDQHLSTADMLNESLGKPVTKVVTVKYVYEGGAGGDISDKAQT